MPQWAAEQAGYSQLVAPTMVTATGDKLAALTANNLDAAAEFAGLIILVAITLTLNGARSLLDRLVLRRLGLDAARTPTGKI